MEGQPGSEKLYPAHEQIPNYLLCLWSTLPNFSLGNGVFQNFLGNAHRGRQLWQLSLLWEPTCRSTFRSWSVLGRTGPSLSFILPARMKWSDENALKLRMNGLQYLQPQTKINTAEITFPLLQGWPLSPSPAYPFVYMKFYIQRHRCYGNIIQHYICL